VDDPPGDRRTGVTSRRRRLFLVALAAPTLGSSLGIDGGAIFQILAVEDLGLGPTAIGIGLALSTISIPFQIRAARTPLARAVPNLQLVFLSFAVLCWLLAGLVLFATPGSTVAHTALAIAVVAEISLSVLYATAWQPLLGYSLTTRDRQRVNSWGRASGSVTMIAVVVFFGAVATDPRAVVLIGVGLVALLLVAVIRPLPRPEEASAPASGSASPAETEPEDSAAPARSTTPILIAAALLTFGGWPLMVTYAAEVMWPDVNLGFIAAAQVGGAVLAAVLWRPTTSRLRRRSRAAGGILLVCALTFTFVPSPVDTLGTGAVVLALLAIAAASLATIGLGLLELTHLHTTARTAVHRLTIFDVVASTSAQVGFLAAGLLISLSAGVTWTVDPYRLSPRQCRAPVGRPDPPAGHERGVVGFGVDGRVSDVVTQPGKRVHRVGMTGFEPATPCSQSSQMGVGG
jgi:hypothetical protein